MTERFRVCSLPLLQQTARMEETTACVCFLSSTRALTNIIC